MIYASDIQSAFMQKQENDVFLKAFTIKDPSDIDVITADIKKGFILVLKVTPLAQTDITQLRNMVQEIHNIAKQTNADIARLGEERIIVTPPRIKIWKPEYDLK